MSAGGEPPAAATGANPPARRSRIGRSKQSSLFGEILDWMLAPLLVLWPMSVVLTWLVAQGIANKPYDRSLGEMARTLSRELAVTAPASDAHRAFQPSAAVAEALHTDEADDTRYQVLDADGHLLGGDATLPLPRDDERAPPGEVRFRDESRDGEKVRVAYLWVNLPGRSRAAGSAPAVDWPLVQVAESFGKRSRLATEIIKGVILPQFVILPLAVLLVWLALARGIAPLNELQQRIRSRDSNDLSPIDELHAPEEVSPLVRAINDLLGRLDQSLKSQKHFLADAAHQLKTPLAGLRTQAELAQRQIDAGQYDPQALKKTLQHIARSSASAAHMVNQLLAMARAENQHPLAQRQAVDVARLARDTVRDFVPRALEKRIDLGYEGPGDSSRSRGGRQLRVLGHALLLRELIRNLVDNALQYTPAGGTVTVRVIDDPFGQVVVLQVEDSGPGIPAGERERVFEPFYRSLGTEVDGSGLGLAIVREIAVQHEAEVSIDDTSARRPGTGTLVTTRLPAVSSGSNVDSSRSTSGFPAPDPGSPSQYPHS